MNFSNNAIGFLLNGVYGLNLLPDIQSFAHWSPAISLWPLTSQTHEVSALIQFSSTFSPPSQLNIWNSCFLVFRSQSLEFITCQYSWISVTSYFQTSSKDILFSVSLPLL